MSSDPQTNDADPLGLDPGEKLGRLAFVGIALGSFVALLAIISWTRAGRIGSGTGAVGVWTLIAAPILLGVVAGLRRPRRPALTAWQLVLLCTVVAAPALGEGLLCLILILPWNLILAPLVALLTAWISRRAAGNGRALLLLVPLSALLPLLDAPGSASELPPVELEDAVLVEAPIDRVWSSLEYLRLPFDTPAPFLVRLGLPQPVRIEGGGAFVGAERRVVFANGTVVARVTRTRPPFEFDIDLSVEHPGREFFDHWSRLVDSRFLLEPAGEHRTRVTHRTRYQPLISPRWYFGPMERAGGRLVQRYLLEAYARELQRFAEAGPAVSSR
jgi:hypothetical protein